MNITDKIRILAPASQEELAQNLKKVLEDYRIPANVTQKTGIRSLEEARDSWLIVICTPETPNDPEIMKQIGTFLDAGKRNQVLTLLAEGSPESSFPESLLFEKKPDGTVMRYEPLAANIVGSDGHPDGKRLKVERLRLLSPILGVSFDDLMNRSRRRRNRILFAAGTVLLTGAAIFLGFAFSRMRIMMRQNAELQTRYDEAEEAMQEAKEQRDLAKEALAETTALQAETILAGKDTELALLLCLEYLPEMGHVSRLTDVFDRSLETLCAGGYVPVTGEKAYKRTRESELKEIVPAALTTIVSYYVEAPPGSSLEHSFEVMVADTVPEGGYLNETASMILSDYSLEYDYAVYYGHLKWEDTWETAHTFLMITSVSDPEKRYVLGNPCDIFRETIEKAKILADGSLLVPGGDCLYRYDAAGNRQIPVFDGSDDLIFETPFPIIEFMEHQGIPDKLFGLAKHGIAVFGKEPFRLLYTIEDEYSDRFTTAPSGASYWDGTILAALPDGEERVIVGETAVYDAKDGTFLYEIDDHGQSGATGILRVSAEGWMPFWLGDDLYVIDLADGHMVQVLKNPGGDNHALYGEKDPVTGQTSASRILIYSHPDIDRAMPRIFWEYHENATDIPEDLDGKIALAKKLLGTRELISSERKTYHMEEQPDN